MATFAQRAARERPLTPAQWQLVLQWQDLPMAVVTKYRMYRDVLGHDDALRIAWESMEMLAKSFDPSKGVRFSTYAFRAMGKALERAHEQKHEENTGGILPLNATTIYGGGRDREGDPADVAEFNEELQLHAEFNEQLQLHQWQPAQPAANEYHVLPAEGRCGFDIIAPSGETVDWKYYEADALKRADRLTRGIAAAKRTYRRADTSLATVATGN